MKANIDHNKIGPMELMVSFQRVTDGIDQPKFVALAKSHAKIDRDSRESWVRKSNGGVHTYYYLLWASHDNFESSGFTLLVTKSGRPVTLKSALKIYREAVNATEFLTFKP
jgi:hypothetical protein